MSGIYSPEAGLIPGEGQPISNARLVAELQGMAIGIHMFGLRGWANMSAERVQKGPETEQVSTEPRQPRETLGTEGG